MLLMAHEGAHECLLRMPSSRTGSFGSQSFVDLPNAPHLKFRYMICDIATRVVWEIAWYGDLPSLILCTLTCLLLSIPRQHYHESCRNAEKPSTQVSACCSQCSLQALALRSVIPVGPDLRPSHPVPSLPPSRRFPC